MTRLAGILRATLRFGDNLDVRENLDPRYLAGEITPPLLLTIEARLADGMVTVVVESPSSTASASADESLGLGLHNAQERLRLISAPATTSAAEWVLR